jgi:hypothetical protein
MQVASPFDFLYVKTEKEKNSVVIAILTKKFGVFIVSNAPCTATTI